MIRSNAPRGTDVLLLVGCSASVSKYLLTYSASGFTGDNERTSTLDGERITSGSSPTKIVRAASPIVPNMASAAPLDGVLQLDAVHKDLVHESFTCDTRDHEDHTCATSHSVPPHSQPRALRHTLFPLPRDCFDARPGSPVRAGSAA